jgi:hypothetical protein
VIEIRSFPDPRIQPSATRSGPVIEHQPAGPVADAEVVDLPSFLPLKRQK